MSASASSGIASPRHAMCWSWRISTRGEPSLAAAATRSSKSRLGDSAPSEIHREGKADGAAASDDDRNFRHDRL
jgi:hypothetical protein